jgi:hypothetical protein
MKNREKGPQIFRKKSGVFEEAEQKKIIYKTEREPAFAIIGIAKFQANKVVDRSGIDDKNEK